MQHKSSHRSSHNGLNQKNRGISVWAFSGQLLWEYAVFLIVFFLTIWGGNYAGSQILAEPMLSSVFAVLGWIPFLMGLAIAATASFTNWYGDWSQTVCGITLGGAVAIVLTYINLA